MNSLFIYKWPLGKFKYLNNVLFFMKKITNFRKTVCRSSISHHQDLKIFVNNDKLFNALI